MSLVVSLLMTPYHAISSALLLTLLSGCTGSQTAVVPVVDAGEVVVADKAPAARDVPAAKDIARIYADLHQITKESVLVDPQLAMLCVGISQQHVDDARKRAGPHAHTSIRIFMNDVAAAAFRKTTTFPVGSVIVKEKQGLEYNVRNILVRQIAQTSNGVGGMIKRAPGYDPEHGDWEYFYFENPSMIEHGRISSCIECHRGAATSDYVFGDWADGG